jgi:hypothetical protein
VEVLDRARVVFVAQCQKGTTLLSMGGTFISAQGCMMLFTDLVHRNDIDNAVVFPPEFNETPSPRLSLPASVTCATGFQ